MKSITNTARTKADLAAISEYFAERNPAAGARLLREILARCRQLANQPRQGNPRSTLGSGVRSVVVRQYVIYFRATTSGIEVLRVLHGARDITPDMFEE